MSHCPLLSLNEPNSDCDQQCAWYLNGVCAVKAIGEYCLDNCQDEDSYDDED